MEQGRWTIHVLVPNLDLANCPLRPAALAPILPCPTLVQEQQLPFYPTQDAQTDRMLSLVLKRQLHLLMMMRPVPPVPWGSVPSVRRAFPFGMLYEKPSGMTVGVPVD